MDSTTSYPKQSKTHVNDLAEFCAGGIIVPNGFGAKCQGRVIDLENGYFYQIAHPFVELDLFIGILLRSGSTGDMTIVEITSGKARTILKHVKRDSHREMSEETPKRPNYYDAVSLKRLGWIHGLI